MSTVEHLQIQPAYEPLLRPLGVNADWVFTSDRVVPWRTLEDRENCTLDAVSSDGSSLRLHVKRYPAAAAAMAENEAIALAELEKAGIASATLAAWGRGRDGRAFIMTQDLAGFEPADKLIARGQPFEKFSSPTATLAAQLHNAGFHHRDLYLCHFMMNPRGEAKLIDAARVRRLPGWPLRQRWIVKDVAQFWYSMTQLPISDTARSDWLARYAEARGIASVAGLLKRVTTKARRIAAHDVNLNRRQPGRHVSIPANHS